MFRRIIGDGLSDPTETDSVIEECGGDQASLARVIDSPSSPEQCKAAGLYTFDRYALTGQGAVWEWLRPDAERRFTIEYTVHNSTWKLTVWNEITQEAMYLLNNAAVICNFDKLFYEDVLQGVGNCDGEVVQVLDAFPIA